jgi:hypothetical protein
MLKIGITGSRKWDDKLKIKNVIFKLKDKKCTIVSGGTAEGVDAFVKKFCIEFNLDYAEVRPNHFSWSPYCIEPPYMYDKAFRPNLYYARNTKLVAEIDTLLLFVTNDETSPVMKNLVEQCEKKCKKLIVIS